MSDIQVEIGSNPPESQPRFCGAVTLKNGEQASIQVADQPQTLDPRTRQLLAKGMETITGADVITEQRAIEQMAAGNYHLYYLQNAQGEMIGYATVFPGENGSCYINKIQTAMAARGQGIATSLLEQIMRDFQQVDAINVVEDPELHDAMTRTYQRLLQKTHSSQNAS